MQEATPQLAPAPYVTIALYALISGLSPKAIRRKIEDGKWIEGREYRYSPDGMVFISVEGAAKWVESGQGSKRARRASASNSRSTAKSSASA